MAQLELQNIKTQYDSSDFVLEVPELLINKGEFFGLIGESGCGKTTLLKTIGGLHIIDQGDIHLDGKNISHLKAELRNMSMVFQEPLLFPHMNVIDNICFPLKVKGMIKSERYKKAEKLLEQVGLTGFDKRYPSQLSGGQQQRVSIARAIIHKPDIVLMDEPFSALDPELRDEMRHLIKKLQFELKITVIFVTHQLDEAAILFDRVAMISDGQILQTGIPSDIYKEPATIEVAKFFGFKNIFRRQMANNTEFVIEGSNLNLGQVPQNSQCVLIPNHAINRINDDSNNITIHGTILEKNFVHGLVHFLIDLSGVQLHYFESMSGETPLHIGNTIKLHIQTAMLRYFND